MVVCLAIAFYGVPLALLVFTILTGLDETARNSTRQAVKCCVENKTGRPWNQNDDAWFSNILKIDGC